MDLDTPGCFRGEAETDVSWNHEHQKYRETFPSEHREIRFRFPGYGRLGFWNPHRRGASLAGINCFRFTLGPGYLLPSPGSEDALPG